MTTMAPCVTPPELLGGLVPMSTPYLPDLQHQGMFLTMVAKLGTRPLNGLMDAI